MHLHFEKSINAKCDCSILSMSWMGKVPDELPEEEGWKLNRTHYYQEGWLATGNLRGIVGVTFTSSHWRKNLNSGNANGVSPGWMHDLPQRTNYNLRGHRSQITLVQWNEPYQKLASCDSSGIIFVWIKFEGRWSIELINDRSTPVTHFSWSHDGRMALICYRDGFVLVGSVAGQRYWSSMLNLNAIITSGLWSPNDQQVFLGTSNAQVIVMDVVHGMMISQVQMPMDSPILSMTWSCEKFKMEENDEPPVDPTQAQQQPQAPGQPQPQAPVPPPPQQGYSYSASTSSENAQSSAAGGRQRPLILAIAFQNGTIFLMRNYDDIAPLQIYTGMQQGLMMEWSNSGEILAVVGTRPVEVISETGAKIHEYFSSLHFYNHSGVRVLNIVIPSTQWPVTALTWGHNDKRLFIATGQAIHVGWVAKRVASLQLLCRLTIYKALSDETCVSHLPLPLPVRSLISSLHTQTILSILPSDKNLLEFVSHPPCHNMRLHCTMIRHDDMWSQSSGTVYTLYLEYLGGLIPILKGKRTSKIRPHFVIYNPQGASESNKFQNVKWSCDSSSYTRHGAADRDHRFQLLSDSSDSEDVELCASPRLQRKRHRARMRERERERLRERELEWERSRENNLGIGGGGENGAQQPVPPTDGVAAASNLNLDTFGLIHPNHELAGAHQLVYSDVLPELHRIVEVTSNIWGTRFKIHGLDSFPPNLGSLSYKTSVLHLQPRQMTCIITELTDDIFVNSTTSSVSGGVDSPSGGPHGHGHATQLLDESDDMFSIVVGGPGNGNGLGAGPCTTGNVSYYSGGTLDRHHEFTSTSSNNMSFRSRHAIAQAAGAGITTGQFNGVAADEDSPYVEFVPAAAGVSHESTTCTTGTPARRQLITHAALIERIDEGAASTSISSTAAASSNLSPSHSIPGPSSLLSSHRSSVHSSPTRRRRISWTKLQHEANSTPHSTGTTGTGGTVAPVPGPSQATDLAPPPPVQPIHVRRSVSASFLENVLERTLPAAVDMVTPDLMHPQSPPKRLVLVKEIDVEEDEDEAAGEDLRMSGGATECKKAGGSGRGGLKDTGKSKSLDFAELVKWKQERLAATTCENKQQQQPQRPCPNCKFPAAQMQDYPSGASPVTTSTPTAIPSSSSSSYPPKTPARKPGPPPPLPPKTPLNTRRRDSNEDRIERLATESLSSTPTSTPPASPARVVHAAALSNSLHSSRDRDESPPSSSSRPPATQTPNLHRRLSNFLTPILRRRDLFSCTSGSGSEKRKGNPNSASFIPPDSPTHIARPMSRSSPNTPAATRKLKTKHQSYLAAASSPIRQFFANSPLLSRRKCGANQKKQRQIIDSTDEEDEDGSNDIEVFSGCGFGRNGSLRASSAPAGSSRMVPPGTLAHHAHSSTAASGGTFRDLETWQKNQLRQKLRKKKIHNIDKSPVRPKRREFILHNKAPMWNENSQVYQLDFGGRVTQESAKNFQIEFRGKQVMQFGRIDGNAYTLDFQYPFSALQAFGVALANVTQRLK